MVQSLDNPFGSVESLLLVLSRGYLPGKLFRPLSRAIVFRKEHERTQLKFRTPQSVTCRSDNEILAFSFARRATRSWKTNAYQLSGISS
jgi:hypothetical protein